MRLFAAMLLFGIVAFARIEFSAPVVPPKVSSAVQVEVLPDESRLEGQEFIRFRNDTGRPIGRIALPWHGETLHVSADSVPVARPMGQHGVPLYDLSKELTPGDKAEILFKFAASFNSTPGLEARSRPF